MINTYTILHPNSKDQSLSLSRHQKIESFIATYPPRSQKRKMITDHNSVIIQTTTGINQLPITQESTSDTDLKEEIKDMVKEIRTEIMNQVQVYFKDEISAVMKEIRLQMKEQMKDILLKMIPPQRQNEAKAINIKKQTK